MSASMKAAIHMGPDCIKILEVCQNTNFEELQNLFDITQKLVHKQREILNVRMIECASPSWTRSSLAQDQAIMWSKAKVRVFSDSVLWLGKMTDPTDANRRWEGQVEEFQQTDSHRELLGIDGEPIELEWNISQDLRHWKSSEKPRKTCKNKTLNLKILKTEPSSCRCSDEKRTFRTMHFKFRTSQELREEIHAGALDIPWTWKRKEVVWKIKLLF